MMYYYCRERLQYGMAIWLAKIMTWTRGLFLLSNNFHQHPPLKNEVLKYMSEVMITRRGGGDGSAGRNKVLRTFQTQTNMLVTVPATAINNEFSVRIFGAGGGGLSWGGGGGGWMNNDVLTLIQNDQISVNIGQGGKSKAGGSTSFGTYLSASGGSTPSQSYGGNGGSGGYCISQSWATYGGIGYQFGGGSGWNFGGNGGVWGGGGSPSGGWAQRGANGGTYGGGGGGGPSKNKSTVGGVGGNGGIYGGGGGGGNYANYGIGGEYGGNGGGYSGSYHTAENSINTLSNTNIPDYLRGSGIAGSGGVGSSGGGGGYGGNGGSSNNGWMWHGGGGGGYGSNGHSAGGGGGYGGDAGGTGGGGYGSGAISSNGGGGGYYCPGNGGGGGGAFNTSVACGGDWNSDGSSGSPGICIVEWYEYED